MGAQARQTFLRYFENLGHTVVKSFPLIPEDDPSLFFVNAGMVPFKDYFTGKKRAPFKRAASSQKCLRVSGKHNDFENVGKTVRHHTFFEMLGNFSFGDYFKEDAICFAWAFFTKELSLPKDRLYVSVYKDDDESYSLWKRITALPDERIVRLGKKDCFWSMGDIGPCGPCSEILIDQGESLSCGKPDCKAGCDCDRFLELWNLVFMQYLQSEDGQLSHLPKPSIDTGMGLERILSVIEGVGSNYETSLFVPIFQALQPMVESVPLNKEPYLTASRVIADHIRASSFLILDGVMPANEAQGYVLKRIIRRAIRYGRVLGLTEPFMYNLVSAVSTSYEDCYPELLKETPIISKVILNEEEKFCETLERGLLLLEAELKHIKGRASNIFPGKDVFKLYDTYGFPVDMLDELLKERGVSLDMEGFLCAMEKQRERARGASIYLANIKDIKKDLLKSMALSTKFVGYDVLYCTATVLAVLDEDKDDKNSSKWAIFNETPFYPEGGGQLSDKGRIWTDRFLGFIEDAKRHNGYIVHKVKEKDGVLIKGMEVNLEVDTAFREGCTRAHTGTHLLHAMLRKHLGSHVRQAGSLVEKDRFRFDFTHFSSLEDNEIKAIEKDIQKVILRNIKIQAMEISYDEAIKKGALAYFGEKYGSKVRVVEVPDVSLELCGGTHVKKTGEIGLLKIAQASSVGSGLRRVEALVGLEALRRFQADFDLLGNLASIIKTSRADIGSAIYELLKKIEDQKKIITSVKKERNIYFLGKLIAQKTLVNGIPVVHGVVDGFQMSALRELTFGLKEKLPKALTVIGSLDQEKGHLVVQVHGEDLASQIDARKILEQLLNRIKGKGGGRRDFAQAGGLDTTLLRGIINNIPSLLEGLNLS